jgi:hypothetical protein
MKLVDDIVYEVETKFVTVGGCDIACNPDDEGGDAGTDDSEQRVLNIIESHKLVETNFTKKQYLLYIKGYMKRLKTYLEENNPSRVEAFQAAAAEFVKKVLGKFDDYQFFTGESVSSSTASSPSPTMRKAVQLLSPFPLVLLPAVL